MYMLIGVGAVATCVGFITLNSQRLEMDLQAAEQEVKTLEGLIPICAHCKNIRDDEGFWSQFETYVSQRTEAKFTHGICPQCIEELYPEEFQRIKKNME